MMYVTVFSVCFGASVLGAICGIGGGVVIKPLLDSFGVMDVTTISFLSGCTVLSMTTYTMIKNKISGSGHVTKRTGLPLSLGAAGGGMLGKWLFSYVKSLSADPEKVGAVQAACLLVVTLGTLLYTLFKDKIHTHRIESIPLCIGLGVFLGILSSFLGIGGGPINLVVFFFFFSMSTKIAAENSLYVIFFSQLLSLLASIVAKTIPVFETGILLLMALGGVAGGIFGRNINQKMDDAAVDKLFIGLMMFMILINVCNVFKFLNHPFFS